MTNTVATTTTTTMNSDTTENSNNNKEDNSKDVKCSSCNRMNCPCGSLCECQSYCRCVISLQDEQGHDHSYDDDKKAGVTITLQIEGMTCTMCSKAIHRAITSFVNSSSSSPPASNHKSFHENEINDGSSWLVSCSINALSGVGMVHLKPGCDISAEQISEEVEDAGYECSITKVQTTYPSPPNSYNDRKNTLICDNTDIENVRIGCQNDDETYDQAHKQQHWNDSNSVENIEKVTTDMDMEDHMSAETKRHAKHVQSKRNAFLISLVGSLPIFFLSMIYPHLNISPLHPISDTTSLTIEALIMWILATFVQFYCGRVFYKGALQGIRQRVLGMDVLICIGTTAAYSYAMILIIMNIHKQPMTEHDEDGHEDAMHGAHFFETSAVLISFVFLGQWLQAIALRRTSNALLHLLNMTSKTATVIIPRKYENDNEHGACTSINSVKIGFDPLVDLYDEEVIPTRNLQKGMFIKITRGCGIPTDCILRHGSVSINEACMTGESNPVLKTCDLNENISQDCNTKKNSDDSNRDIYSTQLLGGTLCVEGAGIAEVSAVGSQTAFSQIVNLMRQAQHNPAPIQDFADRVSSVFVPLVCIISLVTFLSWILLFEYTNVQQEENSNSVTLALLFSISVLVISCPCALGLATPTAVMVGTGVGASHGILLKGGGAALQSASDIKCVVLDKTGTLTIGEPRVQRVERLSNLRSNNNLQDVLWLIASLERSSEHPLAQAIVRYVSKEYPHLSLGHAESFTAVTGKGASGIVQGTQVAVGNRAYMKMIIRNDFDIHLHELVSEMSTGGMTAILCAIENEICAVIGLSDVVRSDARAALTLLQNDLGLEVWMVTGDANSTAQVVARNVGIKSDFVVSEALPATKVRIIHELQRKHGRRVAMIGDGINDAPALAEADVGMAISVSSDKKCNDKSNQTYSISSIEIASEAADIVLLNDRHSVWQVVVALHLSRIIFRRIKVNYLWALMYNCMGIPIAAGLFYPWLHWKLEPLIASLAMALSSISVVASSLTLKLYSPPKLPVVLSGET